MADFNPIRVSELPEVTSVGENDYLVVDDGIQTSKIKSKNYNERSSRSAKEYADEASRSASLATQRAESAAQSVAQTDTLAQNASTSENNALDYSRDAEAWAKGTKNGAEVPVTDETHENNAKYYSGQAHVAASAAAGHADRAEQFADVAEVNSAAVKSAVASEFSANIDYAAGSYVWHENRLYQFIVEHLHGEWIGTDVGQVILSDDVAQTKHVLEESVADLEEQGNTYCQELEVDSDGLVYLLNNGERIAGPYGPFAGGGGGGGNNAKLEVKNTSGWTSKTIGSDADCIFSFEWSSTEDNIPTGDGTLTILVNNAVKHTETLAQGSVYINLTPYLESGRNSVTIQVEDTYGNSRTLKVTVNMVAISIESSFDYTQVFGGEITFSYTPYGAVSKTVYFYVDGSLIGTQATTVSGRQVTYVIPAQEHGAHDIRVYFTSTIGGETVQSNDLQYEVVCIEDGATDVIIASNFFTTSVQQYSAIQIPYIVYDPSNPTTEISLYANDALLSTQTVDRSEHSYTYKAVEPGTLYFDIVSGSHRKRLTITVVELDIDVEPETQNLALYLSSQGRSNSEANPGTWTYNTISAEFQNFNWTSDGWIKDHDGVTVLRVSGDDRVTIPYQIFKNDFRSTGKTIEIEFATRNVLNYDAIVLSCMSEGRGLSVSAQSVYLVSEQSTMGTQYKENEHVRIAFVAEKRSENRLLYVYINGIMSGVVQYPDDDDFSQPNPVGISIGSSECTIDMYCIRVYDNDLTRYQILTNWIADTQNGEELVNRYNRNNIYDAYGKIVIAQLPNDLPYFIQAAPQLPQYKGDKKTVSGSYTDPMRPSKSFTFSGAQSDVQGTSSQYYPRKNYKIKFKNGFVNDGKTSSTYGFNADSIPVNTFTMKADVASSEGANNVELAKLYNSACPYKTPAQELNPKVRQGIDGYPMVMFWDDGTNVTFLGKYNFNNDKGTEEIFGFEDPDESWEVKNNTSSRVIWKSDDYTGDDWLNDFEARYPDTDPPYIDPTQLAEFASWIVSTDTTQATGDSLETPVTYGDVTYSTDNAEYRLAKFKNEFSNYVEVDSALFYYLFTELFLMVDSRAKNMFPSFMGTPVIGGNE